MARRQSEVMFCDVRDSYPTDDVLCVKLRLADALRGSCSHDHIALLCVGWLSHHDALTTASIQLDSDGSGAYLAVFDVSKAALQDGEFYQLCYIHNSDDTVLAASTPFQFISDDYEIIDEVDADVEVGNQLRALDSLLEADTHPLVQSQCRETAHLEVELNAQLNKYSSLNMQLEAEICKSAQLQQRLTAELDKSHRLEAELSKSSQQLTDEKNKSQRLETEICKSAQQLAEEQAKSAKLEAELCKSTENLGEEKTKNGKLEAELCKLEMSLYALECAERQIAQRYLLLSRQQSHHDVKSPLANSSCQSQRAPCCDFEPATMPRVASDSSAVNDLDPRSTSENDLEPCQSTVQGQGQLVSEPSPCNDLEMTSASSETTASAPELSSDGDLESAGSRSQMSGALAGYDRWMVVVTCPVSMQQPSPPLYYFVPYEEFVCPATWFDNPYARYKSCVWSAE